MEGSSGNQGSLPPPPSSPSCSIAILSGPFSSLIQPILVPCSLPPFPSPDTHHRPAPSTYQRPFDANCRLRHSLSGGAVCPFSWVRQLGFHSSLVCCPCSSLDLKLLSTSGVPPSQTDCRPRLLPQSLPPSSRPNSRTVPGLSNSQSESRLRPSQSWSYRNSPSRHTQHPPHTASQTRLHCSTLICSASTTCQTQHSCVALTDSESPLHQQLTSHHDVATAAQPRH